ncbi:hypothetical protein ACF0H5_003285 [Mactra antiquata]
MVYSLEGKGPDVKEEPVEYDLFHSKDDFIQQQQDNPTHRRPEVGHDTSTLENNDNDLDMGSQNDQNQTPETPDAVKQTPSGTTSQNKSSTVVPDVSNHPPQPPEKQSNKSEWYGCEVIKHRKKHVQHQYLVKWVNGSPNQWILSRNVSQAAKDAYNKARPMRKKYFSKC